MRTPLQSHYDAERPAAPPPPPPPTGARRHLSPNLRTSSRNREQQQRYRRDEWQHHEPYRARRSSSFEGTGNRDYVPARILDDHHYRHHQLSRRTDRHPPVLFFDDQDGDAPHDLLLRHRMRVLSADSDDRFDNTLRNNNCNNNTSSKGKELQYYLATGGLPPPSSSSGDGDLNRNEILLPKSMYLDDTSSARSFFTLPPPETETYASAAAANLVSTSIGGVPVTTTTGIESPGHEYVRYLDRVRERYNEGEKHKLYARDVPYPGLPPSQQRTFGAVSSSGVSKEDFLRPYQESFQPSSKGFDRGSRASNFRGEPSGFDEFSQRQILNTVKRQPVGPLINDDSHDYIYSDDARTERLDHGLPSLPGIYKQKPGRTREEYLHKTFIDPDEERVEEFGTSSNILRNSNLWDHHIFLKRRPVSDYQSLRNAQEYIPISRSVELSRPPMDHEFAETGGSFEYLRDDSLEDYRERSRSPHSSDRYIEVYTEDINSPRKRANVEDVDVYDPRYDRVWLRRQYATNEEDRVDPRSLFPSTRNKHAMVESSGGNEPWTSEARMRLASSKQIGLGRPQSRTLPRRAPGSDAWFSSHDSESGWDFNLKKRMKPGPSDFHGSFQFNRRQDLYKPYKFWKNSKEDQHGIRNAHDGDIIEDDLRSDVMEDSEEFKQQIQKCFLRFSKLLNENSHEQKKFREQGKVGSLLCCICGSLSKEYADTHSLVMHAYNCLKTRFRADHLGLHKALCVLMGWNWQVAPDNAKLYQSSFTEEVKAMKMDLIIWPPLVIVHNSSIRSKNIAIGPKIIDNEGMEEILRGIGFAAGKARVCRGKPANQSVMLVKFLPTFSGLQEAEKLHKYYVDNKRGRKEIQEISSSASSTSCSTEAQVEQLLYGYMATAEDMDNLDPETKKRCVIKSKRDIEAIADAPLTY